MNGFRRARCWSARLPPSRSLTFHRLLLIDAVFQFSFQSRFFFSLSSLLTIRVANAAGGGLRYRKAGLSAIYCSAEIN